MKVIFIEDVHGVGRVGQSKVVANGYARNYLFPRRLAVLADSPAAAAIDAQLKKKMKLRALEEAELSALAEKIAGLEITIRAKVGENDKLYGSITAADISEALSKAAGREIDKKKIELPESIKQAGLSDVTVRLGHEITAVIKVNVISEEATEEKPEKKAEKAEAKAEKKEKKGKKEKPPEAEPPAEAVKGEKPPKEKKVKKAKVEKEAAPAAEETPAAVEKKEKKPRAKAKKTEAPEEKKES